jgi:hypothetical protein
VHAQLEGFSDADFIAKGRRFAAPPLAESLGYDYGRFADWFPAATLEQLDLLGFVEKDWLRIAVWSGRQWETRDEALALGPPDGDSSHGWRRAAAAEVLRIQGRRARDRLRTALEHLAGGQPAWRTRIQQAYARSNTAEPVADALVALANVADAMLPRALRGAQMRTILSVLSERMLALLRETSMNPDKIPETPAARRLRLFLEAQGRKKGRAEGEAEGRQDALLTMLRARGFSPSQEDEARIRACVDTAKLDRWIARAATAATVREALGTKASATPGARRRAPGRSRSANASRS